MHPRNPHERKLSLRIAHSEYLTDENGSELNLFVLQHLDNQFTAIAEHPSGALLPLGKEARTPMLRRQQNARSTPATHRAWMERELYSPLRATGYARTGLPAKTPSRSENLAAYPEEERRVRASSFWDSLNEQLLHDTFRQGKPPDDLALAQAFEKMLGRSAPPARLCSLTQVFSGYTVGCAEGLSDLKRQLHADISVVERAIPAATRDFLTKSIYVCSLMSPDAPLDLSIPDLMVALSKQAMLRT